MANKIVDQELAKLVSQTAEISPSSLGSTCGVWSDSIAPEIEQIEVRILDEVKQTIEWTKNQKSISFSSFEKALRPYIFLLARLFISLFLCMREMHFKEQHPGHVRGYKWQKPTSRLLGTSFGKVRYWRSYLYQQGAGFYPLDLELGLTRDGFSIFMLGLATRIATKMSYAQTVILLGLFLEWSPAQATIEESVLGFGQFSRHWFESAPVPADDGEVLVIQLDSKATPTATEEELEKRRGPRAKNAHPNSQRHRGKAKRQRSGKKTRRKKGDKSKNGRMSTIVVMYTLRRSEDGSLEGPINKKVYASYAPKKHAVAIARREADKRGFDSTSGKLVQIVTDGDNDLARYINQLFPEAIHTIDVFHVTEYLWEAGHALFKEGSDELLEWVEKQKKALYSDKACEIIAELDQQLSRIPKYQKSYSRLKKVRHYISKRLENMNYKSLREQDLEISSGAVEGAVNYVIARRFDCGGMRWIKERAEALLQLRCIEVNGDWDAFIEFVHYQLLQEGKDSRNNPTLKCKNPAPLPNYGLN